MIVCGRFTGKKKIFFFIDCTVELHIVKGFQKCLWCAFMYITQLFSSTCCNPGSKRTQLYNVLGIERFGFLVDLFFGYSTVSVECIKFIVQLSSVYTVIQYVCTQYCIHQYRVVHTTCTPGTPGGTTYNF